MFDLKEVIDNFAGGYTESLACSQFLVDNCHIQQWLVVHSLCNQLLLGLSVFLFNTLQTCSTHIEDVHEEL